MMLRTSRGPSSSRPSSNRNARLRPSPSPSPRTEARVALALALIALLGATIAPASAAPAAVAAPSTAATPAPAAPLPPGSSALDAWGAWREAEGRTYRLAEDGVRRFSCDVESSLVSLLSGPGGPLEGDPPRIRLWWRMGEVRATLEGGSKLDPDTRGRLAGLIEPISEMILPYRPSRGLVSHVFRFLPGDTWARVGEKAIEATARRPGDDPARAIIAIGPDGLVARERIERADGSVSEFEYEHVLRNNRYLLKSAHGTFRGMQVSVQLEWELEVARRPLPTRLQVEQRDENGPLPDGLATQVFRFTHHQVNGDIPADILPEPPSLSPPSLDDGTAK